MSKPLNRSPGQAIRAEMWPLEHPAGYHRIEAAGIRIARSRYAINRMAKALFDRGYRGTMEVYGPSAVGTRIILRFTCVIEKNAARQSTETSVGGFRRIPWTEIALKALDAAIKVLPATESADDDTPEVEPPVSSADGVTARGHGKSNDPTAMLTGDDVEQGAVT